MAGSLLWANEVVPGDNFWFVNPSTMNATSIFKGVEISGEQVLLFDKSASFLGPCRGIA
jgi:hypothetical protein